MPILGMRLKKIYRGLTIILGHRRAGEAAIYIAPCALAVSRKSLILDLSPGTVMIHIRLDHIRCSGVRRGKVHWPIYKREVDSQSYHVKHG